MRKQPLVELSEISLEALNEKDKTEERDQINAMTEMFPISNHEAKSEFLNQLIGDDLED